ncbi:hypothetical protein QAD02_005755 [Eretmocerus hayati]|uniref:Uncharacterized protein n=1 Tax=Eretmocerus hayati TaxID=131215 RepID=A0ACC2NUF9_9HYME|nr:hypothetical protein QAD02_005755 [Eretmocerus hayati]
MTRLPDYARSKVELPQSFQEFLSHRPVFGPLLFYNSREKILREPLLLKEMFDQPPLTVKVLLTLEREPSKVRKLLTTIAAVTPTMIKISLTEALNYEYVRICDGEPDPQVFMALDGYDANKLLSEYAEVAIDPGEKPVSDENALDMYFARKDKERKRELVMRKYLKKYEMLNLAFRLQKRIYQEIIEKIRVAYCLHLAGPHIARTRLSPYSAAQRKAAVAEVEEAISVFMDIFQKAYPPPIMEAPEHPRINLTRKEPVFCLTKKGRGVLNDLKENSFTAHIYSFISKSLEDAPYDRDTVLQFFQNRLYELPRPVSS